MGFKSLILLAFIVVLAVVTGEPAAESEPKFTAAEKEALAKLRPLVDELLYEEYMKYDGYLIRFLRAKNLNVKSAAEAMKKNVAWRKKNRIDSVVNEPLELEKMMPYTVGPVDRYMRPIGVFRVGKWKLRRIAISGKTNEAARVIFKIIETMADKVIKSNEPPARQNITSAYMILDLNGYNSRDHACLACTPLGLELFQVYENYYPEGAHKIVGVNVPRLFEALWAVLKPVMSPKTLETFVLYGHNKQDWRTALRKDISDDQIPDYLSGNYVTARV